MRFFAASLLSLLFSVSTAVAQIDPDLLSGLKARSIGPAAMSGRVADIVGVESNPDVVYIGAATGGLWKSVDGGLTFEPIFDDQPVAAIGAVSIFQRNPDIVWVGTGEANVRNSMSVGNGVYRSLDAGRTWKHLGLEKSERISRIILHPTNPDVAWVAALGPAWSDGGERGVYRTDDAGRTWKRVLQTNDRAGAADLAADPSNPNHLIASMWEYRRWPWFFHSGGPGSGMFVTWDGGASWKNLTEDDGLPKGMLGRAGIGFSRSNPNIVYALVEAEKSALVRSTDGGRKWTKVNEETDIVSRPFYYADLRVDPQDPNRIYSLETLVKVSEDGGKSFSTLIPYNKIHPDHHAMWVNPQDPTHIIEGNDGGVAVSRDRGQTWRFVSNLPLGQFYHVNYDMETPYNIYGGMQDNGSWRGPSEVWENGGIRNHHWQEVGFGDGFATLPIPGDPTTGYAMSQEGYLVRWNLASGERKDIRPAPPAGSSGELRFNWNAGIAIDPFDSNTVYYGSQYVHKSTDRGDSWTVISPDLTTNRREWQNQAKSGGLTPDVTGAENFTTIMTIGPSARERGVIWVGTDDGRIQVTRDGGANWTSVEGNVKGVPANTWVPHVEPSKFDAASAFAVFDNHRRGDWTTYVYRTDDYGKTWKSLATADLRGYALVLEQDPVDPNLLFLGTEFGLWFSNDGGKKWIRWTHGFPTVSSMALAVHPREHDLIIGTHGRAGYVIDDITPLRGLTSQTLDKPVHLFPMKEAIQHTVSQTGGEHFPGDTEFRGENPAYGAMITFSLNAADLPYSKEERERERKEKERAAQLKQPIPATGVPEVKEEPKDVPREPVQLEQAGAEKAPEEGEKKAEITVRDATGNKIRTFKVPVVRGINRAYWDLRRDAFKQPPRESDAWWGEPSGPQILPGTYNVTVKYGTQEASGSVNVVPEPRSSVTAADRQARWEALMRGGAIQDRLVSAIERVRRTSQDVDVVLGRAKKDESASADPAKESAKDSLRKSGAALKAQLDKVERLLWVPPNTKGIVDDWTPWSRISGVMRALESSWGRPTPAQIAYMDRAEQVLNEAMKSVDALYAGDVAKFREEARKTNIELLGE